MFQIVEEPVDHEFDLADHHSVAMLEGFLRHEARMDPAHDHRHTPRAVGVRDLIAPIDVTRHRRDADKIGLKVEIDRLDVLVGQNHLVAISRHRRSHGQQPGQRGIEGTIEIQRPGR